MTITTTGNAFNTPASLIVGDTALGTLTINGAPAETRTFVNIGVAAAGNGTMTLTNNASLTINDATPNDNRIKVGVAGTGTLIVQSGSDVVVNGGNYASLIVGEQAGSTGTATFTGVGTTFNAQGADNGVTIGYSGTGTLNVLSGATLTTLQLVSGINAAGTVNVDGAGSKVLVSTVNGNFSGYATDAGFSRFGVSSNGTLNVTNGGVFEVAGKINESNAIFSLGRNAGSYGKAIVDGAGSLLHVRTSGTGQFATAEIGNRDGKGVIEVRNGAELRVEGESAQIVVSHGDNAGVPAVLSELRVLSGGDVNLAGDNVSVGIGQNTDGNGKLTVSGAGSTLNVSGDEALIMVGQNGAGELLVSAGGVVTTNNGSVGFGNLNIGTNPTATSNGVVTVTGNGSKIVSLGDRSAINVGQERTGTINVTLGGDVEARRIFLGNEAGSTGTMIVDGAGSTVTLTSDAAFNAAKDPAQFVIGNKGGGTATIRNSATVTLTGAEARITVGDGYGLSAAGPTGVFNVQTGAVVTVNHGTDVSAGFATIVAGSQQFGNGTINVSGANTKLISQGLHNEIAIGGEGTGVLNVTAGGEVVGHRMFVGSNQSGTGTVTVNGAGSKLTLSGPTVFDSNMRNPALWIGTEGTGSMTLSNGAVANITGDRAEVFVGDAYGVGAPGETGTLNVQSGAVMTIDHGPSSYYHNALQIGNQQFGNGTVTVTGAGSKIVTLGNNDRIAIGNRGTGVLNVLAGGAIEGQMLEAATDPTGTGTILIDGATTKVTLASGAVYDPVQNRARLIAATRGDGTVTVRNGATVEITGARAELHVGAGFDGESAVGIMNIQSGAKVTVDHGTADPFWNVIVGSEANATGTLTVTGASSELISRGIDNQITVGAEGTGTLNIASGGVVRGWAVNLANDTGSNGTINVTGPGSKLILSNDQHAGGGDGATYAGNLVMGRNSGTTSALNVSAGGVVEIRDTGAEGNPALVIGRAVGSTAVATVTGLNSAINVTQTGASTPGTGGAFLNVGRYGDGLLNVSTNAQVNVTGNGTYAELWISRGHDTVQPQVAESEMKIFSGADVTVSSTGHSDGASVIVGVRHNANGRLTLDGGGSKLTINGNASGTTFSNTARLVVGNEGLGFVTVQNNADIIINGNDDRRAGLLVGGNYDGNGSLTVTGTGSTVTLLSTNTAANGGTLISVGVSGGSTGVLNILNGGQVLNNVGSANSAMTVGPSANSASVVVNGGGNAATLLDAGALLVVGASWSGASATLGSVSFFGAGPATVSALSSGVVRADQIAVGSGGTLTGNSLFDGSVTLGGGGKITPGASPGILTISGALIVDDGVFNMEVNGLAAGTQYDQVKVNGVTSLLDADFNLVTDPGFNFADGNRLTLIDGGTALTVPDIAFIDVTVIGEPANLGWQIASEGFDFVFEALNNGTGAAIVEFGATSGVKAVATIADGSGTGAGGRFNMVKFAFATGLDGTAAGDVFTASGSADVVLRGLGGDDKLTGGLGNDTLEGGDLNDVLIAGGGNDTLDGGLGNDSMTGGAGDDVYILSIVNDSTVEAVGGGTDLVKASVTHALRPNVENLELTGTGNINGTGNALANDIKGNSGSNILNGLGGADVMTGLAGNDTYYVDNLGDTTSEAFNAGIDIVRSSVDWTLGSDLEKLYLLGTAINATGNALSNFIYGNASNNLIDGGAGADRSYGGNGSDIYIVDSAGDLIFETSAAGGTADEVRSSVNHTLSTNVEILLLTGTANINGTGNSGINTITGNTGNNFINGLAGNDTLAGGGGNDQFLFTTAIGGANTDTITDFDVVTDTMRLDDMIFTGLALGTLTAAQFVIGAAAADASDRIIYNSATGALLFDSDGAGGLAAKQFAIVSTGLAMTNADFFVF